MTRYTYQSRIKFFKRSDVVPHLSRLGKGKVFLQEFSSHHLLCDGMGVPARHKVREHNPSPHFGCRVKVLVQQMLQPGRQSLIISSLATRQGYGMKYLVPIYILPSQCREVILLDIRST